MTKRPTLKFMTQMLEVMSAHQAQRIVMGDIVIERGAPVAPYNPMHTAFADKGEDVDLLAPPTTPEELERRIGGLGE